MGRPHVTSYEVDRKFGVAIDRLLSHTPVPEDFREAAGLTASASQKRTSGERARLEGSQKWGHPRPECDCSTLVIQNIIPALMYLSQGVNYLAQHELMISDKTI